MGHHSNSPSANQDTWQRVARDVEHDHCYDDASCGEGFRERLGETFDTKGADGFSRETFEEVCREKDAFEEPIFKRKGSEVRGDVPLFLTRAVKAESLVNHLVLNHNALRRKKEELLGAAKQRGVSEWTSVSKLPGLGPSVRVFSLAYPDSAVVFATFTQDDTESPEVGWQPGFGTQVEARTSSSASDTPADFVVRRLALDVDPNKTRTYVLLYYEKSRVGLCRYPTPPDAEFAARFRPVDPASEPYGKTDPDPLPGERKEDLAVPEVVHKNPKLEPEHVWFLPIGPTS